MWKDLALRDLPTANYKTDSCDVCSINDANMLETYPELRAFLLNKERKGLAADDFRISLYLTIGEIGKYIGRAVIMKRKEDGEIQNLAVSELSFPPFGSVLQFEPYSDNDIPGLYCINFFANNFNYDEAVSINLELPVLECNTQYPCDFRTKEQIISNFDWTRWTNKGGCKLTTSPKEMIETWR